jgi:NAD(P)-dependent dehydrogenase (short-subunit alcohol dehydrogenase family)
MAGRLEGKVALVTGGTSGIGRRMVERFVAEGARVAFSGRRAAEGAAVAAATGAIFVQADAGIEADAARSVAAATGAYGRLDILVNNAGAPAPAPATRLQDTDLAGFDATIAVHVRGSFAHIKHAAPAMRAQSAGSIVNIGSVAAHRAGYSASIVYGVAKAALLHLTRCAAMELGEDGIRVNSISPGGIATGIFAKAMGMPSTAADATAEKVKGALAKLQAIPRAGLPDDIASAALFLASDEAGFITAEDVIVDGGLIAGRRYAEVLAGGSVWKSAIG